MDSNKPESARRATSVRTRGRILDAALTLFNERGTAAVSTNHIAAEAGISPGNLYYHFQDKQEIIRALFEQYENVYDQRWRPASYSGQNLAALHDNIAAGSAATWAYRFFMREMLALLRADPVLRAHYNEVYQRQLGAMQEFAEQLVAQRMMVPPKPPRTIRDLTIAVWLIAEGWLSFLDVTGDSEDPEQVAKGSDLIMVALDPYLTTEGRSRFAVSQVAGKQHHG